MPRDSKGRFTAKGYEDNMILALPSFFTVFKMIIFAIIIYPWYYIISRQNFLTRIFEYLFYGRSLSMSTSDSNSPPPKTPY